MIASVARRPRDLHESKKQSCLLMPLPAGNSQGKNHQGCVLTQSVVIHQWEVRHRAAVVYVSDQLRMMC